MTLLQKVGRWLAIPSLLAVAFLVSGCRTPTIIYCPPPPATVQAGDKLIVTFHRDGEAAVTHKVVVKEDGTITVPLFGQFSIANKPCEQVAAQIKAAILDERPWKPLQVTVKPLPAPYVYVRGEVKTSGRVFCDGKITLTKAIAAAGDLTEYANRKKFRIIRSNGKEEIVTGLTVERSDPLVYPGDQIIVLRK